MILVILLLGLCFGSFLNVLLYRLPRGLSILGRSYCPRCKKPISWSDNIPLLSFILLKGKCRKCKKKISLLYPITEFSTAIIFGITYLALKDLTFGSYYSYLIYTYLMLVVLIPIFVIDLKRQIIPDELVFSGLFLTFFYLLLFSEVSLFTHLFSALTVALFLFSLHIVTGGKGMGLGDVKLGLLAGLVLGFPHSVTFLYLAFISGALVGLILLVLGLRRIGQKIAFGPFLALALWVIMIWGGRIWVNLRELFLW